MTITEDYRDGYKAGARDKLDNKCSEILWYADTEDSQTFQDYSRGYRDGWKANSNAGQ